MDLVQEVTRIVAELLDVPAEEVGYELDLVKELGLDSIMAIDLATALEKRFGTPVPDEVLDHLVTVKAIVAQMEALLGAKSA